MSHREPFDLRDTLGRFAAWGCCGCVLDVLALRAMDEPSGEQIAEYPTVLLMTSVVEPTRLAKDRWARHVVGDGRLAVTGWAR